MPDLDEKGIGMRTPSDPSAIAMSGPIPAPDLGPEIANADLIVVAAVADVSETSGPVSLVSPEAQPAHDQLRVAELAVVRTLAGENQGGPLRVLFLVGKVPSRPWIALTQGQTLLLFLRSTSAGYVPVVPTKSPIQTLLNIAPPPAGVSRIEAVVHELEQIVLTADPTSDTPLIIHACMARIGLPGDADLRRLGSPALQDQGVRRAAWIAIALAEGKVEALAEVPSLFVDPAPPPATVLWSVIAQKVSELRAPAARAQLTLLLQSPAVALARAAARALRNLHDPAAIPALAKTLNHPDQETRYHAVMGLAELEPSVGEAPAFELFRSDEAPYIQRWKQWWKHQDSAE